MRKGLLWVLGLALVVTACSSGEPWRESPPMAPPVQDAPGEGQSHVQPHQLIPVTDEVLWTIDIGGKVLRSADGGRSWFAVTPAVQSDQKVLAALDPDHAWVLAGGKLFLTVDGGKRWQERPAPSDNALLAFIDAERGWALVSNGAAAGSQSVTLSRTTDGGVTWTSIAHAGPGEGSAIPFGGSKYGLTFLDQRKGWLAWEKPVPGKLSLLRTTDGGLSWQEQAVPVDAAYHELFLHAYQPFFLDKEIGYLPVSVITGFEESRFLLYRTEDGGDSWQSLGVTPELVTRFTSTKRGWALGPKGLLTSDDGGATWSLVATNH